MAWLNRDGSINVVLDALPLGGRIQLRAELELDLPRRVDPGRARATLRYGVLVVMAPISEQGSGESRPKVS